METQDVVVASYTTHEAAEAALQKLAKAGFEINTLSIIGKGYHTEEKVVGFYNIGDRIKFWGGRGAFWGGLWGLFFSGVFMTIPIVGHLVVLGYVGAIIISAVEGAAVAGALGALGAALVSLGIPKDSVINYESLLKADGFLVMAHGSPTDTAHARKILEGTGAAAIDHHAGGMATAAATGTVPATA